MQVLKRTFRSTHHYLLAEIFDCVEKLSMSHNKATHQL